MSSPVAVWLQLGSCVFPFSLPRGSQTMESASAGTLLGDLQEQMCLEATIAASKRQQQQENQEPFGPSTAKEGGGRPSGTREGGALAHPSSTMPPRASKKRAASSGAVAAAATKQQVDKTAKTSLVEQLETSGPKCSPRSSKRVRSEDGAVQKALADNFPGFSEEEMFINKIGGKTLAQQIKDDRAQLKAAAKLTMGKLYYANLRQKYQSPKSVWAQISVNDENEAEDKSLTDALIACYGTGGKKKRTTTLSVGWRRSQR